MNSGYGKQKGSQFERKICNQLSLWVSGGKRRDLYWRSAMSGGRATVAYKKGETLTRQAGDITATSPEGHALTDLFYFELKHYKDLQIDSFLIKGVGNLAKFWRDTVNHAQKYKRNPVLIAKQNNMPTLVISQPGTISYFRCPILTQYTRSPDPPIIIKTEIHLLSEVLKSAFKDRRVLLFGMLPRPIVQPKKTHKRIKLIRR